jgi:hypothetical protein
MNLTGHIMADSMIASSKSVDNASSPAWRDTAVYMIVKASWKENLPNAQVQQIHERFTNKIGRAMLHQRGKPVLLCAFVIAIAKLSQCDQYEPDWQGTMYGPNYSRL